jgi:hypothetical protein
MTKPDGKVESACVHFVGKHGSVVSLAFDGQAVSTEQTGSLTRNEYAEYTDKPVMGINGNPTYEVTDLWVVLNNLDCEG